MFFILLDFYFTGLRLSRLGEKRSVLLSFLSKLRRKIVERAHAHHFFVHVDQMSDSLIVIQYFVHSQYFLPNIGPLLKLGVNLK